MAPHRDWELAWNELKGIADRSGRVDWDPLAGLVRRPVTSHAGAGRARQRGASSGGTSTTGPNLECPHQASGVARAASPDKPADRARIRFYAKVSPTVATQLMWSVGRSLEGIVVLLRCGVAIQASETRDWQPEPANAR
jgi:hypothetical protein